MRDAPIPNSPTHITYRLYGSIPNLALSKLQESYRLVKTRLLEKYPLGARATEVAARQAYREALEASEQQSYLNFDDLLDQGSTGPGFLAGRREKKIIIDSWQFIARRYGLRIFAISVMSNHVHVLLENRGTSLVSLHHLMHEHKRYTGVELNRLHDTKGRRVWAQKEYSRTVRYGFFERTLWYVLNNPVKAGLTEVAEEWYGNWYSKEVEEAYVRVKSRAS